MRSFLFLLFIPFFGFSQISPSLQKDENGNYYFQNIIENQNTAEQNYIKCKEAITYLYNNSNWTIKLDEKSKIITKGIAELNHSLYTLDFHHTMTIDIKENKIRITFTQLTVSAKKTGEMSLNTKPTFFYPKSFWDDTKKKSLLKMIELSEYFKINIESTEEEW
jgi:hypothetical protein